MRRFLILPLVIGLALSSRAAETILVVGDSHTAGSFGQKLDDSLRAVPGGRVATYGVCSASPQSYFSETPHPCGHLFRDFSKKPPAKWLGGRVYKVTRPDGKGGTREIEMVKTPDLVQLQSDHAPTVTVVALGSNMPISADSIKRTLEAVHKSGSACVWIGPPDMRRPSSGQIDAVYATLAKNRVSASVTLEEARKDSCRLIDSRAFAYLRYPEAGEDGTHYGGELAPLGAKWGADAAAAVLAAFKP
jgi:hypothetical protein